METVDSNEKYLMKMYTVYFIITLVYNAVLLGLYLTQVFSDHKDCLTKKGANVGTNFEFAFIIGLAVDSADIINSNFMASYFRSKTNTE